MKAAIYSRTSPRGVRLAQVSPPKVTRFKKSLCPSWVECRVHSVGINPVDAKFLYADKLPPKFTPLVQLGVEERVVGLDFAGVVTHAAPDSGYHRGDEVFGTVPPYVCGALGEFIVAPTDRIYHKPRNLSFAESCALPLVSLTALQSLENHSIGAQHHVLVIGASGGTGHVTTQVAKIKGAKVTAICSQRNESFVRNLGADEVILYDQVDDIIAELEIAVKRNGKFDFVFDSVSSHDPRDSAYNYEKRIKASQNALMSSSGMYLFIGGQVGDWFLAHIKRFFKLNLFEKGRELFWIYLPNTRAKLAEIKDYCERNRLRTQIAEELPFTNEGVQSAFAMLMNRRTVGKVVINLQ